MTPNEDRPPVGVGITNTPPVTDGPEGRSLEPGPTSSLIPIPLRIAYVERSGGHGGTGYEQLPIHCPYFLIPKRKSLVAL